MPFADYQTYYAPPYATAKKNYLQSRCVCNYSSGFPNNVAKTRAALVKSASGGMGNFAAIGTSISAGFLGSGTNIDPDQSWCNSLKKTLVNFNIGIADGGSGVRPAVMAAGGSTTDWSFTGNFTNTGINFLNTPTTGTATYASRQAGTVFEVQVWNASATNIAWTFDGVAQAAITTDGSSTWKYVRLTGQTNATHTAVFTSSGAPGLILGAASVSQTTGLLFHNLSISSARWNTGSAVLNWGSGTANHGNLPGQRLEALTSFLTNNGVTLDAVFLEGGLNDLQLGTDAATTLAGLNTVLGYSAIAGADVHIINTWRTPTNTEAQWDQYLNLVYQMTDIKNLCIWDWNDRVGGQANAVALGLLAADGIHGSAGEYAGFGKNGADLLVS